MEILAEEECLTVDGFDEALVGCTYGADVVAVYDINKMIEILICEGMDYDDAVEHLDTTLSEPTWAKTPQYVNFVTQEVYHD